ncbi:MAG: hypothetical protein PHQ47_02590 [Candidatus Portnoybacteria bacterium]|nr:hypothetical protein [Candidatus Portnoybacteria bacterium]
MKNGLKKIFKYIYEDLLAKLGFLSIIVTVVIFWIGEHSRLQEIKNNLEKETIDNLMNLETNILPDKEREWLYLVKLSNTSYKVNWNYIKNKYSENCVKFFSETSFKIDSINTLLDLRQWEPYNKSHSDDLHKLARRLDLLLKGILLCNKNEL